MGTDRKFLRLLHGQRRIMALSLTTLVIATCLKLIPPLPPNWRSIMFWRVSRFLPPWRVIFRRLDFLGAVHFSRSAVVRRFRDSDGSARVGSVARGREPPSNSRRGFENGSLHTPSDCRCTGCSNYEPAG